MTQLSANFTLEEMPCWERATPADVARLQETVTNVLQPARDRWGRIRVTSWKWWKSSSCSPRTGSHAGGGTVDFISLDSPLRDVFEWGVGALDRDYVGRWIFEPYVAGVQGAHIHVAPRADMWDQLAKADSSAWVEGPPNTYTPVPGWGGHSGTFLDPIEVEGIEVTVSRPFPDWLKLALAGVGFGIILRSASSRRLVKWRSP